MVPFKRMTPEEGGVSSRDLYALLDAYITRDYEEEVHSFLLLRHGALLAAGAYAPYSLKDRSTACSCSGILVATAAGFAMAEGLFSAEDAVADCFPEYLPEHPKEAVFRIQVKHLLMLSVGQADEAERESVAIIAGEDEQNLAFEFFRSWAGVESEGALRYDRRATYMLSLLIRKTAGTDVLTYLTPRLFEPLGVEAPPCIRDENGVPAGWTGVRLTVGELARIGQLYLDGGRYSGKQILPLGFAERLLNCCAQGRKEAGKDRRGGYSIYGFCGAFGQICAVIPELDAVFAVFSGCSKKGIHRVWDKFDEIFMTKFSDEPLPPDEEGNRMLEELIQNLAIPEIYSTPSPKMPLYSGRTLPLLPGSPWESVTLRFAGDAVTVELSGKSPVLYSAGLTRPMRTHILSQETVFLKAELETVYSSTARWETQDRLLVSTHIVACPTNLYLEADFKKNTARLYTVRGCF